MRSRRSVDHSTPLVIVLFLTLLSGCTSNVNLPAVDPPELYVLATTPLAQGRNLETRISYDGRHWSGPNYVRDAQGQPVVAKNGIPAGIGTNYEKYLLAFFEPGSFLRTIESVDGRNWSNGVNHGTFAVDQHSRPAIAFDHHSSRWYVAFRKSNSRIIVRSFSAANPQDAATHEIPDAATLHAVGFAITDAGIPANAPNSRLLLAYREGSGVIRIKQTTDPEHWPAGDGADSGLSSESGPFLDTSFGLIRVALTGGVTPPLDEPPIQLGDDSGRLSHGTLSVVQATDNQLTTWERAFFIDGGTTAIASAPAFAGPRSATASAKGNYPGSTTSAWFSNGNNRRIVGFPPAADLPTDSGLDVSMTFGQEKSAGAAVPVVLTFKRFHRGTPDRRQTEDVTLEVEHYGMQRIPGDDSSRLLLASMRPWRVEDARKDATVSFDINGQSPRFAALIQQGEQLLVKITGGDGTVSEILTFDQLRAATHATESQITVDTPANRTSYTVFFIAGLQ